MRRESCVRSSCSSFCYNSVLWQYQ
jgi:hypothetical protein